MEFPARRVQDSSKSAVEVRYSPALEPLTVIHGAWMFQCPVGCSIVWLDVPLCGWMFHCVFGWFHLGIVKLFYHDIDALHVMCT